MARDIDIAQDINRNLDGTALQPGDTGFAAAVTGFQTAHPHRPDLVVAAASAQDVRIAVRHAARHDLPLAVQSTGHGRGRPLDGGILITTGSLRGVTVDPLARTARVEAGARWADVVAATTPHGLAPLSGSSPDVGVVGYLLGGGFGLLARRYGYAIDQVATVWAVERGGADVQMDAPLPALDGLVVTAVEIALVELAEVWGGSLALPATPDVLSGYADWTAGLPDELTSALALVPFPDLDGVPAPLRGRHVAQVRVTATVAAGLGQALVAPLRDLAPVLAERLSLMPFSRSHTIFSDPTEPHAYAGDARLLGGLDRNALRTVPEVTGPNSPAPSVVELRHLGGAMSRPSGSVDAAHRGAGYLLRAVTMLGPVTEVTARERHAALFAPFAREELGRTTAFCYGL